MHNNRSYCKKKCLIDSFVVLQKQDGQSWKPVVFIFSALTPVECTYVQIEKEALALTWACEQRSNYTYWERPSLRLMHFHFKEVNHVLGKELHTAEALSRMQPTTQTERHLFLKKK